MATLAKPTSWWLYDTASKSAAEYLKISLRPYFEAQLQLTNHVPPGYHLLYLNPREPENNLLSDGYDARQAPPGFSFKRRLWVGGKIIFHSTLYFGSKISSYESVKFNTRGMNGMNFVRVGRNIFSGSVPILDEFRTLAYVNNYYEALQQEKSMAVEPAATKTLRPTELLLFRFSALTFNAHKIHYDKVYAEEKEGYPNIIVHGPLLVVLMLEWLSSVLDNLIIKSFEYKIIAPIFVSETIILSLSKSSETQYDVWIDVAHGKERNLRFKGSIEVENV